MARYGPVAKAPRLRFWKWTDPIYNISFLLFKGTGEAVVRHLRAHHGLDERSEDLDFDGAAALTWNLVLDESDVPVICLWVPAFDPYDTEDLSTLAHESTHAAVKAMGFVGQPLTPEGDEAYAYYLGWVFKESLRRLKGEA